MRVQQLVDPEKKQILTLLQKYQDPGRAVPNFPTKIDKRKYTYIKSWATARLSAIDVDRNFAWLSDTDRKIMTDTLEAGDEQTIIRIIRDNAQPQFYFIRFYELVQNYRNYLLIRVRHHYYQITGEFLDKHRDLYYRCRDTYQRLHQATHDIVDQYSGKQANSRIWEQWLLDVFYDESLDGLNRYYAVVRLSFLYYNYKEYDRLLEVFNHLDKLFSQGQLYSRRILANYYANRLLLHVRHHELDAAETYGYLSIRYPGNDYLYYLTNLSAVLLKSGKHQEARKLLTSAFPELKKSISPHTRIGFTSYYLQALVRTGEATEAVSYAQTFMQNNLHDILQQRWHLFFTSFNLALIHTENFKTILSLAKKYKLAEKDLEAQNMPGYIPNFRWQHELARYKQLQISNQKLIDTIIDISIPVLHDQYRFMQLRELCTDLKNTDIQVFSTVYERLFRKGYKNVTPRYFV